MSTLLSAFFALISITTLTLTVIYIRKYDRLKEKHVELKREIEESYSKDRLYYKRLAEQERTKLRHIESLYDEASMKATLLSRVVRMQHLGTFGKLSKDVGFYELKDGRKVEVTRMNSDHLDNVLFRISIEGRSDAIFTVEELYAIECLTHYSFRGVDINHEIEKMINQTEQ